MDYTEVLIELVKTFPCIYNYRHVSYRDIISKENAWKTIGHSLNIPVEVAQKRWKSIRDKFVRESKAVADRSKSGAGHSAGSPWPFFPLMEFYTDLLGNRGSKIKWSNVSPPSDSQDDSTLSLATLVNSAFVEETDEENSASTSSFPVSTEEQIDLTTSTPKSAEVSEKVAKKRRKESESELDKLLKQRLQNDNDENEAWGLAAARSLKRLKPQIASKVKLAFHVALCELDTPDNQA